MAARFSLAQASQSRRSPGLRAGVLIVALLAVLGVVLVACTERGEETTSDPSDADDVDSAADDDEAESLASPDGDQPEGELGEAGDEAGVPEAARHEELGDLDADEGSYLVRDGSLTLMYDGAFERTYDDIGAIAGRLGGALGDVETRTGEDGATLGTVEVEVGVDHYDELLAQVGELGEVDERRITTTDETAEHVDLSSRLRHAERLEDFYLALYDEAQSVDDALAVSDQLEDAQQRVEELTGRLDAIEERSATSTLRVELVPEGYDADDLEPATATFGGYWTQAVDGFVQVAGGLLVIAVGALPLVAAAVALLLAGLLARRSWQRGATS